MLVEHTFVTTLDGPQAMMAASDFLTRKGFSVLPQTAFQLGNVGLNCIELQRGKYSASTRWNDISKLPQQVRLEWDRGRVNVAAVIHTISPNWIGRRRNFTSAKSKKIQADLMTAIASSLEMLLVSQTPGEIACQQWDGIEVYIQNEVRRNRRRTYILLAVLLVIVFGLVGLAIYSATRH